MYDVESAAERLKAFAFNGIDRYTFYLKSTIPYDYGNFFMFPTKEAMFAAIADDLYGYNGESSPEEVAECVSEIAEIVSGTPMEDRFSSKFLNRINSQLINWEIQFIGDYETLLAGSGMWEREYRARFRTDDEVFKDGEESPIRVDERARFDEYVSTPEW